MWYPNRAQWAAIWITALVASHVWLGLRLQDWLPHADGAWGLTAYVHPALQRYNSSRTVIAVLAIGALAVWQLSTKKRVAK